MICETCGKETTFLTQIGLTNGTVISVCSTDCFVRNSVTEPIERPPELMREFDRAGDNI